MRLVHAKRFIVVSFALILAVTMGMFGLSISAQEYNKGSELYIQSEGGQGTCDRNGQTVARVYQDKQFGVVLRQFRDNEQVFLTVIFPDGRIFSALSAGRAAPIGVPPSNFPWQATTSNGGDYYTTLTAPNNWPYGCYEVTAWGQDSNRLARNYFELRAEPSTPANPGRPGITTLRVEDTTTGDPSGLHGSVANIFGRGFRAQEQVAVWVTFPDGSVRDYPLQFTSDVGSFASSFEFISLYPTGKYSFTALGLTSGYQQIATFNLSSQTSTPGGWAQLLVLWRYDGRLRATQDESFEISGQFFEPFENVAVWVTLPDNSVRTLPFQLTNAFGEFFAVVQLDGRLPTGAYKFTAQGQTSRRLVISSDVLVVTAGDPVINQPVPLPDPNPPEVVRNNGNQPGTQGGAEAVLTPIFDNPTIEMVPDQQFPDAARGPLPQPAP